MNQGLAQQDCHKTQRCPAAHDGQFSQFWHPDPTRGTRGAKMPGNLGELSCMEPLRSLESKDTGLVAAPLP